MINEDSAGVLKAAVRKKLYSKWVDLGPYLRAVLQIINGDNMCPAPVRGLTVSTPLSNELPPNRFKNAPFEHVRVEIFHE